MADGPEIARTDEPTLEMLTESLMPGQSDALSRLFSAHGAPGPRILWSPRTEDLPSPILRRFSLAAAAMAGDDGKLRADKFDPGTLGGLAGWTMVLERDGDTYRYRYYGENIAGFYGRDMTGETTAAFSGHIGQFFEALYTAAAARGESVFSEHEPPADVFVRVWRRIIVPLFDAAGAQVTGFAVANVPDNELRAGLELMVDPVLVMDAEQVVYFANRAAQKMFGLGDVGPGGATLRQLTALDITPTASPGDMLADQLVDDTLQLTLRGGIAERLVTTISAAEHRGIAFYVVVLRKISA